MRLLLTNDDGYDAPGLQQLVELLSAEHDCYVVAPDQGRSCCGHSVTNATELELVRRTDKQWSVSGTPADCVRIGLMVVGLEPDWVISGINHGGNMGIDTLYSGTVAAAREATILGFKSIAISQYMRRDVEKNWRVTAERGKRVLHGLWDQELSAGFFWNINLPALAPEDNTPIPVTHCPLELGPLPISYQAAARAESMGTGAHDPMRERPMISEGEAEIMSKLLYQSNYQLRPRTEGTDVHYCFSGHAVITRLQAFGFCPDGC